jgi:hypothetical protein
MLLSSLGRGPAFFGGNGKNVLIRSMANLREPHLSGSSGQAIISGIKLTVYFSIGPDQIR